MRDEADASERLAQVVSYRPDKAWLQAKAAELRRQAEKLEAHPWRTDPEFGGEGAEP